MPSVKRALEDTWGGEGANVCLVAFVARRVLARPLPTPSPPLSTTYQFPLPFLCQFLPQLSNLNPSPQLSNAVDITPNGSARNLNVLARVNEVLPLNVVRSWLALELIPTGWRGY